MRLMIDWVFPSAILFLFLAPTASATPTVAANPGSVATDSTGAVTVDIGNLAGSDAILRLFVDANGNGSIDPPTDYAIWTDVIPDNVARWSPAQFSDLNGTAGIVSVAVRGFGPFEFPYTAGTFVWQAEDSADGSTQTTPFTITQAPQAQSVTGTVTDSSTLMAIPGAFVVLLQFCDSGEEGARLYSAFTDASGQYDIEVPSDVQCLNRVVVSARPGYVTDLANQPLLTFGGSDNFVNQDVQLTPGTSAVNGRIEYSSGPEAGNGIPGLLMFADGFAGGPRVALTFTDDNGDYSFTLTDGNWDIGAPEENVGTRGAVEIDTGQAITVSGGMVVVPDITLPASNAYFQGVLRDEMGLPLAGRFVSANENSPCTPDCGRSSVVTDSLGNFTLGVNAPMGPATGDYSLNIEDPLPGLIAEQHDCQTISEGSTTTGIVLAHLASTRTITGTLTDVQGEPIPGFCVNGSASGVACRRYESSAVSGCDGSYTLPAVDGSWGVRTQLDGLASQYGDFSSVRADRQVNLAGNNASDVDFIFGPARSVPHITGIEPVAFQPGQRILIEGYGFSQGSAPQVFFDAIPASVVDFRIDQGFVFVDVPGSLGAGTYDITLVNVDTSTTSPAYCQDVLAGPFVPACSITGTTTDSGGPLSGVSVAFLEIGGGLVGYALTDGSGAYSGSLPAAGDYEVFFIPPAGLQLPWAGYTVTCGNMQSHLFSTGFELSGSVVDFNNDGIEGALVQVDEVGGSGYYTQTVTDSNGDFLVVAPAGTFDFSFEAPPGSRYLTPTGFQQTIAGPGPVGQTTAQIGSFFGGTVLDAGGNGEPAEVTPYDTGTGQPAGKANTDTCTGRFNLAVPFGQYRVDLEDLGGGLFQDASVKWADISGDLEADFDFTVFDPAVNPPLGAGPVVLPLAPSPAGQAGQPLVITAGNLAGSVVDVLFGNGSGGFVAGTSTLTDPGRGLVITRVPAAAATGTVKVRVDGLDSAELAFIRIPGTYPAGVHDVSGTISGPGNAGAIVALSWQDNTGLACDEDLTIVDYAVADGSGNYGPISHPGGDIDVLVLPDSGSTSTVAIEVRLAVTSNITVNPTLTTGIAVSARAVDAGVNPVPNALFELGDDQRMTDASGNATIYVPAGDYEVFVIPPPRTRLFEFETTASITVPINFGDIALGDGSMVSSAILAEADATPVPNAIVEAERAENPFDFFFEGLSGPDGKFDGPIAPSAQFQLLATVQDDLLGHILTTELAGTTDCILHPALKSPPAGAIDGLVRDATSLLPLPGISIVTFLNDGGIPGDLSGFAPTCDDGTYRAKVAAGSHFLRFDDFQAEQYGNWHDDAFCFTNATPVNVTTGNTTTIDADLSQLGSISGTISAMGAPLAGAFVCATSVSGGGCVTCSQQTDGTGVYTISVPPESDYRVEAITLGLGNQCYDGFNSCSSFTPVVVTAGTDTPGIDFAFGCTTTDVDLDGVTECGGDCNDNDPANYPGNDEICDFQDNDCDFLVDDGDPGVTGAPAWYVDIDTDGFGDAGTSQNACAMPGGFVADNTDCDDADPGTYPGAPEINDGQDNQCSGDLGAGLVDELSGTTLFANPGNTDEISWPAQAGATMYEVARTSGSRFAKAGLTTMTGNTFFVDSAQPAAGEFFYYLIRPSAPRVGSWGAGADPRRVNVLTDGDMDAWINPTNLTDWNEVTNGGTIEQETDPAMVAEGLYAARLTRTAAGSLSFWNVQNSLRPGYDHVLSLEAKFDRVFTNEVLVRVYNFTANQNLQTNGTWAAGVVFHVFDITTDYQTIELPFTVDAGFASTDDIRVLIAHRAATPVGSILWIDDVRISEE